MVLEVVHRKSRYLPSIWRLPVDVSFQFGDLHGHPVTESTRSLSTRILLSTSAESMCSGSGSWTRMECTLRQEVSEAMHAEIIFGAADFGFVWFFFGENLGKFDGWSAPLFRIVISGSPWLDKPIYHHLSPPCSWQTLYRFTTVCFMQKTILCIWYMYIYIHTSDHAQSTWNQK